MSMTWGNFLVVAIARLLGIYYTPGHILDYIKAEHKADVVIGNPPWDAGRLVLER